MKIYTKTGDRGQTTLIGGRRVRKDDARLEAYGTVDELNSFVGLLLAELPVGEPCRGFLQTVQHRLFDLGSTLALDSDDTAARYGIRFPEAEAGVVEAEIDRLSESLAPLHTFVLPGGCRPAALCHVCRTVCRRAERRIHVLDGTQPGVPPGVAAYVNRLSDYFFVLARYFNRTGGDEIFYVKA